MLQCLAVVASGIYRHHADAVLPIGQRRPGVGIAVGVGGCVDLGHTQEGVAVKHFHAHHALARTHGARDGPLGGAVGEQVAAAVAAVVCRQEDGLCRRAGWHGVCTQAGYIAAGHDLIGARLAVFQRHGRRCQQQLHGIDACGVATGHNDLAAVQRCGRRRRVSPAAACLLPTNGTHVAGNGQCDWV